MQASNAPHHRARRRLLGALSVGLVLSLAPVGPLSSSAPVQASATSVTGLARGATGDAVRSVQQALIAQGVAVPGGADGVFGKGTETALKSFQSQRGLPASGVVDEATALELGLASNRLLGLSQGVRGDAVRELQTSLQTLGLRVAGGADGIFGPGTAAAVAEFQKIEGISPSGRVDAATAVAIARLMRPADTSGTSSTPKHSPTPKADPAPASSAAPLVGLKIGARGDLVAQLQQAMMDAGFTVVGGADGVFGVLTANALRSFQNANGLGVTGVVDAATAGVIATIAKPAEPAGGAHNPAVSSSPLLGLQYGSIGSDVKALQQALIAAGITVRGGADGVFGTATQAAVKAYQSVRGLSQSGRVDEATANALANGGSSANAASNFLGLQAGALGNTVKQLQEALMAAGIKVRGGADGIFGPATANAVKEFQTAHGLEATGRVDDATMAAFAKPSNSGGNTQLVYPTTTPEPTTPTVGYPQYGEHGERVVALQQALIAAGIAVRGGADGVFGAGTSAAVMEFQRVVGLVASGKVDEATSAALALAKTPAPEAPAPTSVTIAAFPVQGLCSFSDTWGAPRSGGRSHLGVDIMAPSGKYIYAVVDGTITKTYTNYAGSLAGNGVRLTMSDGTYFFYAHMDTLAEGITVGSSVRAGQIIGTVGKTGNAGTPHLHFEIHPQGGVAVDPYQVVKAVNGCKITDPLPQ
ncbi:MAG TPA: peptidoglycan-binding protein [Ilumatobacter sp.]